MSALRPIADFRQRSWDVRLVPQADGGHYNGGDRKHDMSNVHPFAQVVDRDLSPIGTCDKRVQPVLYEPACIEAKLITGSNSLS